MSKRIALACALVCALSAPALAQNNFPTPGGSRVNGVVSMCLDSSGNAAPATIAGTCLGTGGSTVIGGVTVANGADTAEGTTTDAPCTVPTTTTACTMIEIAKAIANGGGGGGGGAVTIADGADVTQGAKADAAYTGSGSASVVGVLKGIYANGSGGGGGTVTQGNAGSNAQAWWMRIGDATNGPAAVKAASTAPATTDPALVVAVSPNNTVAVTQSGAWTVNPTSIGTWGLQTSTQNSATPTNGHLALGQFNTTPVTVTSGNVSPLQMDSAGNLLVNVKVGGGGGGGGAVTVANGADTAEGTTTDTPCTLPATTTACTMIAVAKAIGNAANSSIPAGTNSIGGVTIADGVDVTQGAKADTAYTGSGSASVVAILKGIYNAIVSPLSLGTSNGWTPVTKTAITTAQTIMASAGWLGKAQCDNQNASWAYLQIFNTASPTLGTTVPLDVITIAPCLSNGFVMNAIGVDFSTSIAVAATTTATGATTVTTGLNCGFAFN